MKVIVDVQKLYDELHKIEKSRCYEYMIDELSDILTKQGYPEWAEKKTATRQAKMDGDYTQLFEDVWSAYPKRSGKGTAYIAWKALIKKNDELFIRNIILAALEWQKPVWAKDSNRFVPMLENYIKGRRWEDEAPKQQVKERYLTPDGVWKER